ncbi:GDSL-type esterase/lipase family protein, partial [uncultured Subdoligranulum sp.]
TQYDWQNGWVRPGAPAGPQGQAPGPQARPPRTPEQRRAAARRARARRRRRRRTFAAATVGGILVLSGIITVLLPTSVTGGDTAQETPAPASDQLVAPLPYGGGGSSTTAQALNWGSVGPVQQTGENGYTYTALPAEPASLPEFGRVDTSWFADAAFLGDSLTAGFSQSEYDIDVGGALICGYEGVSPNTIVNRATVESPDRGEEVALDVLTNAQPAKLYILIGTNALVATGNDESFLNYYARMLDELRTALPNTALYVQSILSATQETVADDAPGLAPDRLAAINASIQSMCAERGCYFLDLNAEFSDESGYLLAEYAQPDGVHLTVSGYNKWVSYLCTHVPYNKNNPYQAGSTYYLSDELKQLLSDIP